MKIEIEATSYTTEMDGVPVRLWNGTTEAGIPCKVFIHRIAVKRDEDCEAFDRELKEQMPPTQEIPLSYLLP